MDVELKCFVQAGTENNFSSVTESQHSRFCITLYYLFYRILIFFSVGGFVKLSPGFLFNVKLEERETEVAALTFSIHNSQITLNKHYRLGELFKIYLLTV